MTTEPIGDLLDSLGVEHEPLDGELVAGAVVLLKVITDDGCVTLRTAYSDGMSWLERVGMLRSAEINETTFIRDRGDDE